MSQEGPKTQCLRDFVLVKLSYNLNCVQPIYRLKICARRLNQGFQRSYPQALSTRDFLDNQKIARQAQTGVGVMEAA